MLPRTPPQNKKLWVSDLGRQDYQATQALQRSLVGACYAKRIPGCLLLLEHHPVITQGRHGNLDNLLISKYDLQARGIPYIKTERGGDVTFHGPGQVVGYPIFKVAGKGIKVKSLVGLLEQVLLKTLSRFGIQGRTDPVNPGIWVGKEKVASIGLAIRKGVSFHGFALNVNMELTPFSWIHPCGLKQTTVTSMHCITGKSFSVSEVKDAIVCSFSSNMGCRIEYISPDELYSYSHHS